MPRIKLSGYFGWKESMKVSSASISSGWLEGQCFKLGSGAGDAYSANEVTLNDAGGQIVYGIALDGSVDHSTAVAGMHIPSASKVTILHGHSKFEIDHAAEVAASTTTAAYMAYEKAACESASVYDLLYTNASGKLTTTPFVYRTSAGSASGSTIYDTPHFPCGLVTKVPVAANNYTLGVLLFG